MNGLICSNELLWCRRVRSDRCPSPHIFVLYFAAVSFTIPPLYLLLFADTAGRNTTCCIRHHVNAHRVSGGILLCKYVPFVSCARVHQHTPHAFTLSVARPSNTQGENYDVVCVEDWVALDARASASAC